MVRQLWTARAPGTSGGVEHTTHLCQIGREDRRRAVPKTDDRQRTTHKHTVVVWNRHLESGEKLGFTGVALPPRHNLHCSNTRNTGSLDQYKSMRAEED